jgi:hypothetical protein
MKRQVYSIIVNTLEASETTLEEVDPDMQAWIDTGAECR